MQKWVEGDEAEIEKKRGRVRRIESGEDGPSVWRWPVHAFGDRCVCYG